MVFDDRKDKITLTENHIEVVNRSVDDPDDTVWKGGIQPNVTAPPSGIEQ